MYLTVLKLLSPYLQRYAAKKTAAYLQARRERRLGQQSEPAPLLEGAALVESDRASTQAPLWFAAGGLLIGGAVGYALAYLTHRNA